MMAEGKSIPSTFLTLRSTSTFHCPEWNLSWDNFLSFPSVLFPFSLLPYCHTDPAKHKKSKASVCEPYVLSDEVRVQASLACINSPCQEVAFDPNTQNLLKTRLTQSISVWVRDVLLLASACVWLSAQDCKTSSGCLYCFNMVPRNIEETAIVHGCGLLPLTFWNDQHS